MILGVDKQSCWFLWNLLMQLQQMGQGPMEGGLRPGCFVSPLRGCSMWQAWASFQHGVLEFQPLVLLRTGPESGPASFLLHCHESKQVTSQPDGKRKDAESTCWREKPPASTKEEELLEPAWETKCHKGLTYARPFVCVCVCTKSLSCVWLFVTPWTI